MCSNRATAAEHAVGDIVGKQDAVRAARLVVEVGVELHHAFDPRAWNLQRLGDRSLGLRRKPVQRLLRLAQDLQQGVRIVAVFLQDGFDGRLK